MKNLFLKHLSAGDQSLLQLRHIKVGAREILFQPSQKIDRVIFPDGPSVISLMVMLSGKAAEVSTVGFDGVIGAAAALNDRISLNRVIVQNPGSIYECSADVFKAAAIKNPAMLAMIVRHERALDAQTQQLAACHAIHSARARLSRWLLRTRDLSGRDSLFATQGYLSEMLAIRRTSVTEIAMELRSFGAINYDRGSLAITNVAELRKHACECYTVVINNYRQILGSKPR